MSEIRPSLKNNGKPVPVDWIQVSVQPLCREEEAGTEEEALSTFVALCVDNGAAGSMEESAEEQPQGRPDPACSACEAPARILICFPAGMAVEKVLDILDGNAQKTQDIFSGFSIRVLSCQRVQGKDWVSSSMAAFPPKKISERFWVIPPWERPALPPEAIPIIIEPGLAFGTGKHATTRACLWFMEAAAREQGGLPASFLDVGCGSGILSIAARQLGARRIVGLDIDPEAVFSAKNNLLLNGLSEQIELINGPPASCRGVFDWVTANLDAPTLRTQGETISSCLSENGTLLVSGLLKEQKADMIALFGELGLQAAEEKTDSAEGWTTLIFSRQPRNRRKA